MIIKGLQVPDPNTMTFKEIFSIYDNNFEIMRQAFDKAGDRIFQEIPERIGSNRVEFKHSFSYGKNQIMVFYNGAIQFNPEDYIELDNNRIQFNFDIYDEDEIHGIIIEPSQDVRDTIALFNEMRTFYDTMKKDLSDLYSDMKVLEKKLVEYEKRATTNTARDIDVARGGFNNFYERSFKLPIVINDLATAKSCKELQVGDIVFLLGDANAGDIGKGIYDVQYFLVESDIPTNYYSLDRDNLYLVRITSV